MNLGFYLETYGCALNMADSDMIVARMTGLGNHRVNDPGSADVLIVNTCGVKEPTEDRVIHRLVELSSLAIPLIIMGCLPKISLERILSTVPNFAAILGPQSIQSLGPILERVILGERGIIKLDADVQSKLRYFAGPSHSVICTVPICEGCLGSCAYCAVKFARGRVRSYSISDIKSVVERCIHQGYCEIRLTSQDAGVFGVDTGETLVDLLAELDSISGTHAFRLGMFNPDLVLHNIDNILDVMASDHFFKFFHAPLQSGSDSILHLMKRRYTVNDWVSIVSAIRRKFTDVTIATDIIVGFPGESDADFEETIRVIERVRPEIVNISKYGDRPGTEASRSKEKVDTAVKKDRSRKLSHLVHKLSVERNAIWLDRVVPVLVTDRAPKGGFLARTLSYKPVILRKEVPLGIWVMVSIDSASPTYISGNIIS